MSQVTETDKQLQRPKLQVAVLKQVFPLAAGSALASWVIDREVIIGREVDVDAGILLPTDNKISKRHARLRLTGESVELEDLRSKNHTFVNGRQVVVATLHDGAVLRVGDTLFVLRLERRSVGDAPVTEQVLHTRLLGQSQEVRALRESISRAARSLEPVLLLGPTGVGKELAAAAIHTLSQRSSRPFVAVNCAGIQPGAVESTLFGHKRGAFTGADRDHDGCFKAADTGTLFLDEIGELPLEIQPKLLRALQPAEPGSTMPPGKYVIRILPFGASSESRVDVRLVAATNADLRDDVTHKRFRVDLLQRLSVLPVQFPALSQRRDDILLLFDHYLNQGRSAGARVEITARLGELLLLQEWSGNVRELENLSKRLRSLGHTQDRIDLDDIPDDLLKQWTKALEQEAQGSASSEGPKKKVRLTKQELERLFKENNSQIVRLARALKVTPREIRRKLDKFGIFRPHARSNAAAAAHQVTAPSSTTPTDDDG